MPLTCGDVLIEGIDSAVLPSSRAAAASKATLKISNLISSNNTTLDGLSAQLSSTNSISFRPTQIEIAEILTDVMRQVVI
ncbi:hypothetical protein FBZ93_12237 [Bradyrhizobium macuxiense]|uniref:Uncharacterized protein n=2 Tax=Bradyrhizobium macuxiense TaxID=1755647 RepID=A0A560KVH6_9BRAD|nr:hypothetical protein FBZ93_12237 [Bradyrhizobium macuxiense]